MNDFLPPRLLLRRLAACAAGLLLAACATPPAPWPEKTVRLDQMRPVERIQIKAMTQSTDRAEVSTVVLHVHIDAEGRTVRSRVERSSGQPAVDEGALNAMRVARFEPYRAGGVAIPVTMIAVLDFGFAGSAKPGSARQ